MQVTVDIPDGIASRLTAAGTDISRLMLEDVIAQAYRGGLLTTEEVRRALDLQTRFDVEPFLLKHGIFDYTPEMLIGDLEKLERLRG